MDILALKNTITKIKKNSVDGHNNRIKDRERKF